MQGEFNFSEYLARELQIPVDIRVEALSGGITNQVARVKYVDRSVILKHAPAFIYREGPLSPLSPYRQVVEAQALEFLQGAQSPNGESADKKLVNQTFVKLPKLIKHDTVNNVLWISDLGKSQVITDWLLQNPNEGLVQEFATRLAAFLSLMYRSTAHPSEAAIRYFDNIHNKDNNFKLFLSNLAKQYMTGAEVNDAEELARRVADGEPVDVQDQVLAMRDFWTGSTLVTSDGSLGLVDFEYFRLSDVASELGMYLSNIRSLEWRRSATPSIEALISTFFHAFVDMYNQNMPPMSTSAQRRFLLAYGREHVTATDFAKDDFDKEQTRASIEAGCLLLRAAGSDASNMNLSLVPTTELGLIKRLLARQDLEVDQCISMK